MLVFIRIVCSGRPGFRLGFSMLGFMLLMFSGLLRSERQLLSLAVPEDKTPSVYSISASSADDLIFSKDCVTMGLKAPVELPQSKDPKFGRVGTSVFTNSFKRRCFLCFGDNIVLNIFPGSKYWSHTFLKFYYFFISYELINGP